MLNEIKMKLLGIVESAVESVLEPKMATTREDVLWDDEVGGKLSHNQTDDSFVNKKVDDIIVKFYPQPIPRTPDNGYIINPDREFTIIDSKPKGNDSDSKPNGNDSEANTENLKDELKKTLVSWLKSVEEGNKGISADGSSKLHEINESILTKKELISNLAEMLKSDNPEIAGIAKEILNLLEQFGFDSEMIKNLLSGSSGYDISGYYPNGAPKAEILNIVLEALFSALGYTAANDPNAMISTADYGLSIEQLLALDKNGDGSIVDELNKLLNDKSFIASIQEKIDVANNKAKTKYEVYCIMDKNGNGTITVGELAARLKDSPLANLLKSANGSIDRALIIALGGNYDAEGNYSIDTDVLYENLTALDKNGDGKITQDEIDAFKQTDAYKKAAYNVMMKEMENDNNKFDGKFTLDTLKNFVNNEATAEQKEFFKIITSLSKDLQKYIFEKGLGGSKISIDDFTKTVDCNGDGIVTKEELQKFVDFVKVFYYVDKDGKSDGKLSEKEAKKIEPFKSNPDLWHELRDGKNVKLSDIWNYLKNN